MDSLTRLDYALFQLTPTRTRCDLVIFHGGRSEKLASGLFEPFISHLKFVKDEISKGGYSIKLRPPAHIVPPWFTKGTFQRFVRFVSTPAVLERVVTLEMEISQIDSSIQENELFASNAAGQLDEGTRFAANANARNSSDSYKLKDGLERSGNAIPKENSKIQLKRLLETRKALLRREQAMVYARGLAAGFDLGNTDNLISFADTFGASRLRKACINFKEIFKDKLGDGLWMEEVAAMQACPPSYFPSMGTSGIVITDESNACNPSFSLNFTNDVPTADAPPNGSDSNSIHASLESQKDDNWAASDQILSSSRRVPMSMSMPGSNQIPPSRYTSDNSATSDQIPSSTRRVPMSMSIPGSNQIPPSRYTYDNSTTSDQIPSSTRRVPMSMAMPGPNQIPPSRYAGDNSETSDQIPSSTTKVPMPMPGPNQIPPSRYADDNSETSDQISSSTTKVPMPMPGPNQIPPSRYADDNSETSDQIPSSTTKVPMPMPGPNQIPPSRYADDNSETSDQIPSSTTKVPMPMPGPNQIPPSRYADDNLATSDQIPSLTTNVPMPMPLPNQIRPSRDAGDNSATSDQIPSSTSKVPVPGPNQTPPSIYGDDNSATSDQILSSTTQVPMPMPMPWPNQIHPSMYNFQSHIHQLPPYQGYPYPTMPHVPPHYPKYMHWPYGMKEHSPAKKERYMKKKSSDAFEIFDDDEETESESAESEEGSDSDSCISQAGKHSSKSVSQRKKPRKKSSKTVVIRNINYIAPTKGKGYMNDRAEASSDEDEFIDEGYIKQQLALEKSHKSNSSRHKTKSGRKANRIAYVPDDSPYQDFDDVPASNASARGKTNGNWYVYQNILMSAEDPPADGLETLHSVDVQNGDFTVKSSADCISLSEEPSKQLKVVDDSFLITQRDGGSKDREPVNDFEKAENYRPTMKKGDSMDEDFIITRGIEEPKSGLRRFLSSSATESAVIRPSKGDDWFMNQSGRSVNQDAASELVFFNGDQESSLRRNCPKTETNRKDILVDDSFMVHGQPQVNDLYSQWKTDINMAADVTLSSKAENDTVRDNKESLNACQPDDLCLVLERESALLESRRESWTSDPGIDISLMEADRRSPTAEKSDLALQLKKNETNGRKATVKEAKSTNYPRSVRTSKADVLTTAKTSPLVNRSIVQKNKLEKEEEIRRKMEELQIQRQRRIAERTAGSGLAPPPTKKSPSESQTTKVSFKLEKNKTSTRI